MEIELQEIRDFLAGITPFDKLPIEKVEKLTHAASIRYFRRGSLFPSTDTPQEKLYIIRKGSLAINAKNGDLREKLSDGDICTLFYDSLETGDHLIDTSIDVLEDTLAYSVPSETLTEIIKDHPAASDFIQNNSPKRLNDAVLTIMAETTPTSPLMRLSIKQVMQNSPITISGDASIYESAKLLTGKGISSLLVTAQDGSLAGIITDRDITIRCVVERLPSESPVSQIMSSNLRSVTSNHNAYDVLMMMTRLHIRHFPVIDGGKLVGIITSTDLMRQEGKNSAYLTSAIRKAQTIEELQRHSKSISQLQVQLVKMGSAGEHVGKGVTSITTAITRRLIEMAEEKFGPAPVPYAWVAAGSQARREQTSHTDQDNGLVISDDLKEVDKPWFEAMAKFVCDGLNDCGFIHCPGNVMAMNPKWRQTVSVWTEYFDEWVTQPKPEALLYSSIFFDLRMISGDKDLLIGIRKKMLKQIKGNTLFLALLSQNAIRLKPPLGFFKDFVLIHDGEHKDTLDLKHNAIAPIIDLARIYALAEGVHEVNTVTRLKKAAGTKSLSTEGAANLLDALTFIVSLRVKHQAEQIRNGIQPDNYLHPASLSKLERVYMKDAFKVIQTMQNAIEQRY